MKFSTVFASALFVLASGVAAQPSAHKDNGYEVVIHYVTGPDCECPESLKPPKPTYTTVKSTRTHYVLVTLSTSASATKTLGCETTSVLPAGWTGKPIATSYTTSYKS